MTTKVSDEMLAPDAQPGGSVLDSKGQLYGHSGSAPYPIPAGIDGYVLTADSSLTGGAGFKQLPSATQSWFTGDMKYSYKNADHGNWKLCDGRAVSRSSFSALFAEIGTTFGSGDGSTTFNLPNFTSRLPMAAGGGGKTFTVASVSIVNDTLTVPTNETLYTGQAVVYTSTGSAVGGLTSGNTYYVIRVDATTVKLASSRANAVAGTAIDLTSVGTGTHSLAHSLSTRARGEVGGEERHSLVAGEIPAHTHTGAAAAGPGTYTGGTPSATVGTNTGSTGGSGDHAMMPPWACAGSWFIYAA